MTGVEIIKEIYSGGSSTRILGLSSYNDREFISQLLNHGASGYLLKDEAPAAIVSAVQAAARGQGWFSPAVIAQVAGWARGERPQQAGLTEREREVLRLVARGKTNKEIGISLGVAERTVEFHVGNVLGKLGVASRVEAAVWAKEHLVDP